MPQQCSVNIRVRYVECDPMGYLHHSAYIPYFEIGRIELLRQGGILYRDLEAAGFFFVVAKLAVNFRRPARFDDDLTLVTTVSRQTAVRIIHTYELINRSAGTNDQLLCTAETTLACVNRAGELQPIPDILQSPPSLSPRSPPSRNGRFSA